MAIATKVRSPKNRLMLTKRLIVRSVCTMKQLPFALAAISLSAVAAMPAQAAVTPTPRQILTKCPATRQAKACPASASDFLAPRPKSPESDAQIVDLVLKIAEAAQEERVQLPACLNAADGLRVLATGVED